MSFGGALPDTITERFNRFHEDNPQVANDLERMAREWFAAGNRRVSVQMLWEVLRWVKGAQGVKTEEPYRLNDNFRGRYARLLIARNPEWADRINTRELRTA